MTPLRHFCKNVIDLFRNTNANMSENGRFSLYKTSFEYMMIKLQEGHSVIGAAEKDGYCLLTVLDKPLCRDQQDIHMYRVGQHNSIEAICLMYLEYRAERVVYICDWFSYCEGHGYGTTFLQTVINHLRNNKYSALTGFISSVDYDHYEKLHHIYEKCGFEIDQNNNLYLKL